MKNLCLVFGFLFSLTGCLSTGESSSDPLEACPMIYKYPVLKLNFFLSSPLADEFELLMDGKPVLKNCSLGEPCIRKITKNNNTFLVEMRLKREPTIVDIDLKEGTPSVTRIEATGLSAEQTYTPADCRDPRSEEFTINLLE